MEKTHAIYMTERKENLSDNLELMYSMSVYLKIWYLVLVDTDR